MLAQRSRLEDFGVDDALGQMRKVTQGLVLDLAVFTVGATQQVGAVDLVLVLARRGDDVSGSVASCHARDYRQQKPCVNTFSDYKK